MMNQPIDILDHLPLGVVLTDVDGNTLSANKAGQSFLLACGGCIPAPPDPKQQEYRVSLNGRTMEIMATSVRNKTIFTLKDVTHTMRLDALEKHRETYAAMGEMAANIAHEIRNPLGSIELFASLLKKGLKHKRDVRRIEQILSCVKAVNSKISGLILSTKSCEFPPERINIHELLHEILHYSGQVIDRGMIFLTIRMADMKPLIEGNSEMIRQTFLSLILVALQSLPESNALDIETVHVQEPPCIEIHFRASGSEFLARISGKDANAGIGLAVIHHVMNLHHGTVRIEQHEKASFILSFPLAKENDAQPFKGSS